jgi:hypothetical protein
VTTAMWVFFSLVSLLHEPITSVMPATPQPQSVGNDSRNDG